MEKECRYCSEAGNYEALMYGRSMWLCVEHYKMYNWPLKSYMPFVVDGT
jgi:hypothetical protein